jgi:hypothetical protein
MRVERFEVLGLVNDLASFIEEYAVPTERDPDLIGQKFRPFRRGR